MGFYRKIWPWKLQVSFPILMIRRLAFLTIVGVAYFATAVVSLHFLSPNYNPVRNFLSEYVLGPYGLLMISAFFALALSMFALALGLYWTVTSSNWSQIGLTLLGIAGTGVVMAGIFPTDRIDAPITMIGIIHDQVSYIAFVCFVASVLCLSKHFKKDERWQSFHYTASALALADLVSFLFFYRIDVTELPIGGIAQRIFILQILLWLLFTAFHLRSLVSGLASV